MPLGRDDAQDGRSDHVRGRIPEHALRASIPTRDGAAQVFADDRVVCRRYDERQQILHLRHRPVSQLAFGDITNDFGNADNGTVGVTDGRHGQGDVNESAVFAATHCLIMIDDLAVA